MTTALFSHQYHFFQIAFQGVCLEHYGLRQQYYKGATFQLECTTLLGSVAQMVCALHVITSLFAKKLSLLVVAPPLAIFLLARLISYLTTEGSLLKIISDSSGQLMRLSAKITNLICAAIWFHKKMSQTEALSIALHIGVFSFGLIQEIYWTKRFYEEKGQFDIGRLRIGAFNPPLGENLYN
jgi:hypothetical protein